MTFLHPSVPALDRKYHRDDIEYLFHNGLPTGLTTTVTGSGAVTTVGYDNAKGAAVKLAVGAAPGDAFLNGPVIGRNVVKAVLIEPEGIDLSSTNEPLWAFGLYPASGFTSYVEMYRDVNSNGAMTTQKGSSSFKTTVRTTIGDNNKGHDYDAGLLVNYEAATVTGHVGHSYVNITNAAHIPAVDLFFKVRCIASGASSINYDIHIRRIKLSIWR